MHHDSSVISWEGKSRNLSRYQINCTHAGDVVVDGSPESDRELVLVELHVAVDPGVGRVQLDVNEVVRVTVALELEGKSVLDVGGVVIKGHLAAEVDDDPLGEVHPAAVEYPEEMVRLRAGEVGKGSLDGLKQKKTTKISKN